MARRLGKPLMPWQQHVADVAYELNPDGSLVYSTVVLTVPRQSGKTTFIMAKVIWRLVVLAKEHGPQTSTYVSQKRQSARKKFERDFAPILRTRHAKRSFTQVPHARFRPTRPTEWRLSLNNGSECIQFGDSYWQLEANSEDSGHGDTLDDGTIDEARFKEDDSSEAAMRPAMSTRWSPQITVLSTAGGPKSAYLYRKILSGRAAVESGEHGRTAFFEWSAPDDADPGDPTTWWACMPALGHTIQEDFIQGEWEQAQRDGHDAIQTFRQEYLNQWVDPPVLEEEDAEWCFPKAHWIAATSTVSEFRAPLALSLAVAPDRSWAALGVAGESSVGGLHAGCLEYREGTAWVVDEVRKRTAEWGCPLVVGKGSAAMALVPDLEKSGVAVELFSIEQQQQACGQLYDALVEGRFKHPPQPHLDVSVREAEKAETERGAWSLSPKRSSVDISPLVAVTLAASKHLQPQETGGKAWSFVIGGSS